MYCKDPKHSNMIHLSSLCIYVYKYIHAYMNSIVCAQTPVLTKSINPCIRFATLLIALANTVGKGLACLRWCSHKAFNMLWDGYEYVHSFLGLGFRAQGFIVHAEGCVCFQNNDGVGLLPYQLTCDS